MYNFEPYNVSLVIATNKHVLLMTAFVLQVHIYQKNKMYHPYFIKTSRQFSHEKKGEILKQFKMFYCMQQCIALYV